MSSGGDSKIALAPIISMCVCELVIYQNSVDLKMEVDSGSYWSIISDDTRSKCFANLEIADVSFSMNAYNLKVKPVGVLRNLNVYFNSRTLKLDVLIMPGKGATLFGRSWLYAFGL